MVVKSGTPTVIRTRAPLKIDFVSFNCESSMFKLVILCCRSYKVLENQLALSLAKVVQQTEHINVNMSKYLKKESNHQQGSATINTDETTSF